jgi:hypothetical protein
MKSGTSPKLAADHIEKASFFEAPLTDSKVGCVTGTTAGCNMPLGRRVPSPLKPCALALLQEGSWYGLVPTGYKFEGGECRIAKGLRLGLLSIEKTSSSERQRTNEENKKRISRKRTFATS